MSQEPAKAYPPLVTEKPDSAWGSHIQRTMRLLATSTPENRKKVRILFYGQSITGIRFSSPFEKWLRAKYPNADIELQNLAIGGFGSNLLYRTAESDLYPFYPDLLVFCVYGDHHRFDEIIFNSRQRTTAEVMILTDHWKPSEVKDGRLVMEGWGGFMDAFMHKLSDKYGCELVDVRVPWKAYLEENKLAPQDLLMDQVHPNEQGKELYAQIIERQLVYRADGQAPDADALVKDYAIGTDVKWSDGKLMLEFEGNRVDLISRTKAGTANGSALRILVDGKKPSEFPGNFAFSRPTSITKAIEWPAISRVVARSSPIAEDWSAEILEVNAETGALKYRVAGSLTGPDGEGTSTADFVSKSGRVVIDAEDWKAYPTRTKTYLPGQVIRWKCLPLSTDFYYPPIQLDDLRESVVTLFQGVPNAKHRLELFCEGSELPPVSTVRVYHPPVPAGPFQTIGFEPPAAKATPEPTHTPIVN